MNYVFIGQCLAIFAFSVCNDWVSIAWHEAREKNRPLAGGLIAVGLGFIAWLSIIWVVDESYWLMVPDLLGNLVGSYLGIKHYHGPLPFTIALGLSKKPFSYKTGKKIRDYFIAPEKKS